MSAWLAPPFTPVDVANPALAWPSTVRPLMPAPGFIPAPSTHPDFTRVASSWVTGNGLLAGTVEFFPHAGIACDLAYHHLAAIVSSPEPAHEHKVATVAFLASLWFRAIRAHPGRLLAGGSGDSVPKHPGCPPRPTSWAIAG